MAWGRGVDEFGTRYGGRCQLAFQGKVNSWNYGFGAYVNNSLSRGNIVEALKIDDNAKVSVRRERRSGYKSKEWRSRGSS